MWTYAAAYAAMAAEAARAAEIQARALEGNRARYFPAKCEYCGTTGNGATEACENCGGPRAKGATVRYQFGLVVQRPVIAGRIARAVGEGE